MFLLISSFFIVLTESPNKICIYVKHLQKEIKNHAENLKETVNDQIQDTFLLDTRCTLSYLEYLKTAKKLMVLCDQT